MGAKSFPCWLLAGQAFFLWITTTSGTLPRMEPVPLWWFMIPSLGPHPLRHAPIGGLAMCPEDLRVPMIPKARLLPMPESPQRAPIMP